VGASTTLCKGAEPYQPESLNATTADRERAKARATILNLAMMGADRSHRTRQRCELRRPALDEADPNRALTSMFSTETTASWRLFTGLRLTKS
jgi:hypothetical protein